MREHVGIPAYAGMTHPLPSAKMLLRFYPGRNGLYPPSGKGISRRIALIPSIMGDYLPRFGALQPDGNPPAVQILFDFPNGILAEMEHSGGQNGIGTGL